MLAALLALPATAGAQAQPPRLPAPSPASAKDVERTAATLTGSVDPNRGASTYHFEYGTTASYGLRTADRQAGSGDAPVAVEVPVDGLTPGTTYHYRLVATNAAGVDRGADRTARTAQAPRAPGASTGGVRDRTPQSATIAASIDPNGGATTYHFEWGRTRSYGSRSPDQSAGAGDRGVPVSVQLTGLEPATRYHYRVVATNEAGTTRGRNRVVRDAPSADRRDRRARSRPACAGGRRSRSPGRCRGAR